MIPDAQHAPALENPAYVAEQVIRFVKEGAWKTEAQKQPAAV